MNKTIRNKNKPTKKNKNKKNYKTLKTLYPKIYDINRITNTHTKLPKKLNIKITNIKMPNDFNYFLDNVKKIANLWNHIPSLKKRLSFNSNDGHLDIIDTIKQLDKFIHIPTQHGSAKTTDIMFKQEINKLNKDKETRRFLDNIATEFNTQHFFDNMMSRMTFIYFIINTFETFFKQIYKIDNNYHKNNLNIMFKGGTIIRFVIMEYIRGFNKEIEDFLINDIKKNIKLSDYDFEIISKYDTDNNDIIQLNNLVYLISILIRNYLFKNRFFFFDFFKLNDKTKKQKIHHLKKLLQDSINLNSPTMNQDCLFKDIQIDYIDFEGCHNDILTDKSISNKNNYQLIENMPNKYCKKDYGIIINNENKEYYITQSIELLHLFHIPQDIIKLLYPYNSINKNSRNTYSRFLTTHNPVIEDDTKGIKFQLNRIKYIYNIYFRKDITIKNITKTHYLKHFIMGEIVDLSHTYKNTTKLKKLNQPFHKNRYLKTYTFLNYNLSFISYTFNGLIHDLDNILFEQSDYKPWIDIKYDKRLKRLLYLYIFYFFSTSVKLFDDKKLTDLEKLINLCKYDFKNTKLDKISKVFFTDDKLFIQLINTLYHTSKNNNDTEYHNYKKITIDILENFKMVFESQKKSNKHLNLSVGYLNNNILNIDFPDIY